MKLPPFHESWLPIIEPYNDFITTILGEVTQSAYAPKFERIFTALSMPLENVKVVIFGQDPYPNPLQATGLAFSIPRDFLPIPATLNNIYRELTSDLGIAPAAHGDLSSWADQGVLLLNRTLTIRQSQSNSDQKIGWQKVTNAIAMELGNRQVAAILWGKSAQELSELFPVTRTLTSPHPSPLSAYRGFFGSRPFSKSNKILEELGHPPVDWQVK